MTAGSFGSDAARSAAADRRESVRMSILASIRVKCALRTFSPVPATTVDIS
jgi:c-di-GMP-binding flagellar brake protein YcgR